MLRYQTFVAITTLLHSEFFILCTVVTVQFFCSYGLSVRRISKWLQNKAQTLNFVYRHTLRMLEEAHGKVVMKKTQVYEWHKRFRDGHVNDDTRC
jgi:hypothetical protein